MWRIDGEGSMNHSKMTDSDETTLISPDTVDGENVMKIEWSNSGLSLGECDIFSIHVSIL